MNPMKLVAGVFVALLILKWGGDDMDPMKLVAGVFVALLILIWGTMVLVNRPIPGVDAPGKGGDTARTTGSVPDRARANMSPAVQQYASPANSPMTAQADSASGAALADYPQVMAPELALGKEVMRQKEVLRQEEANWQAKQDKEAQAYMRQDTGAEQFARHVAPRPAVAPAGNRR